MGSLDGSEQSDATYEEWPVQGSLKRVQIGTKVTYIFKVTSDHSPDSLTLSSTPEATSSQLCTIHSPSPAYVQAKKRTRWEPEEDDKIIRMKETQGLSWEAIADAIPRRTAGAIQVHYSTKLKT